MIIKDGESGQRLGLDFIQLHTIFAFILLSLPPLPVLAGHPLESVDTSSPRATMNSFLIVTDEFGRVYNQYREAPSAAKQMEVRSEVVQLVRMLDLSDEAAATHLETAPELAILLWEVIARLELPAMDDIPGLPEEYSDTTDEVLPDYWRIPHTGIVIARVKEGPRTGEYLFSADTIARVRDYYNQVQDLQYLRPIPSKNLLLSIQQITGWMIPVKWVEALPGWSRSLVSDQVLWKWIAEGLLYAVSLGLVLLVFRKTRHLSLDRSFRSYFVRISTPLSLVILSVLVQILIVQQINATGLAAIINSYIVEIAFTIAVVWFILITMSHIAETIITSSSNISDKSLDANLLRLTERTIGTLLIVGIVFRFVQNLGVPVYGLVAGAGVGGVAIALAARSTLENFIGTLNMFADRPVRVGDFCRYGEDSGGLNRVGTIEEIGMRSTRIRGLDRTVTTIPNAELSSTQIVNLSERNMMLLKMEIGLRLDTTTEQLREVVTQLREMLIAHPSIADDPARVRVTDIEHDSIDIELFAYVDTNDWNEFLAVREDVIFRIIRITEDNGTVFAYPTQTIFLGRDDVKNKQRLND